VSLGLQSARSATLLQVTVLFAIFMLPPCPESLNLSRGVVCVECSGWHERPVDAGGVSRGDSARAEPRNGTGGEPSVPARTFNSASTSPFSLQCPLALSAGGPDCPSVGGEPSPSSRFALITSALPRPLVSGPSLDILALPDAHTRQENGC